MYWAVEDTHCCTRYFFGRIREFDLRIYDMNRTEVCHCYRPLRCQACCFPCCLQEIETSAPPGEIVGTVVQKWSIVDRKFTVLNRNGEEILKIVGPCCMIPLCCDIEFKVYFKIIHFTEWRKDEINFYPT